MFFIQFDNSKPNLQQVKTIAKHILDWNDKHHQLSDDELSKLHAITKPTLAADQNVDEIYQLCNQLRETLVLTNDKGAQCRFYVDDAKQVVYFGDDAGIAYAKSLSE